MYKVGKSAKCAILKLNDWGKELKDTVYYHESERSWVEILQILNEYNVTKFNPQNIWNFEDYKFVERQITHA